MCAYDLCRHGDTEKRVGQQTRKWCEKWGVQTVSLTAGFTIVISVLLVLPSAHPILHST